MSISSIAGYPTAAVFIRQRHTPFELIFGGEVRIQLYAVVGGVENCNLLYNTLFMLSCNKVWEIILLISQAGTAWLRVAVFWPTRIRLGWVGRSFLHCSAD